MTARVPTDPGSQVRNDGHDGDDGAQDQGVRYAEQEQAHCGDRSLDGEHKGEPTQVLGERVAEGIPQGLRVAPVVVGHSLQEGRFYPAHVHEQVGPNEYHPEEGHNEAEGAVNESESPAEHAPGDGLRGVGRVVPYPGDDLLRVARQEPPVLQKV